MDKILITGATGSLGNAVCKTLAKYISANRIHVLSRQPQKLTDMKEQGFQTFHGDYDDVVSLNHAMAGVQTVLLISAGDQGDRMQQHKNVIDAARTSGGVTCIAYTSRSLRDRNILANKLMADHFETEDYIKQSGLPYTIFRNVLYMDVIPLFVGKQVFETGIFQPAGEGKVAFALRQEMGEAMANILLNHACENRIYSLTGSNAHSFYDVASVLAELSGKSVVYHPADIPTFEKRMEERGVPGPMIKKIIDFNTDIQHDQEAAVASDLEVNLGRKPATLKEGLKILFNL